MRTRLCRHVCPRNCYNTCGLISMVEGDTIVKLYGDPAHGYSRGHLCRLGYSYLEIFNHPDRVLYPLKQEPRGSGNWRRISWTEALEQIAVYMLDLAAKYGSMLPVCIYNNSGDIGLLHRAWNWLARAMGRVTTATGNICMAAGLDALAYGFGTYTQPDPIDMAKARYLLLWGANPAWTAVHQMEYINRAREKGARLVVIDPVFTATAAQADLYIQIRPGSDGALAAGIAWHLWQNGLIDNSYLSRNVVGWEAWQDYLAGLNLEELSAATGVSPELMARLAEEYATNTPAAIWLGLGLQRHVNGGQNVRTISALAAMTGNLGREGGGVYYPSLEYFNIFTTDWPEWMAPEDELRKFPIYDLAGALQRLQDPPVKMALIAGANPVVQNADSEALQRSLAAMELVVVSDLFLTSTARLADIFLPATTFLEHWDVVPSYWHRWIGVNEPAVPPRGECRSDLMTAASLAEMLNQKNPGVCPFPTGRSEEVWLAQLFNQEVYRLLGINHYRELLLGPRKLKLPANPWAGGQFATPSGCYELYSRRAEKDGLPSLPVYQPPAASTGPYPYRLLTTHTRDGLNSQFYNIADVPEPVAYISRDLARQKQLQNGTLVRLYNEWGEIIVPVEIKEMLPPRTVLCHQRPLPGGQSLNSLVPPLATDMGTITCGGPNLAYYDIFVNITPA